MRNNINFVHMIPGVCSKEIFHIQISHTIWKNPFLKFYCLFTSITPLIACYRDCWPVWLPTNLSVTTVFYGICCQNPNSMPISNQNYLRLVDATQEHKRNNKQDRSTNRYTARLKEALDNVKNLEDKSYSPGVLDASAGPSGDLPATPFSHSAKKDSYEINSFVVMPFGPQWYPARINNYSHKTNEVEVELLYVMNMNHFIGNMKVIFHIKDFCGNQQQTFYVPYHYQPPTWSAWFNFSERCDC